MHLRKLVITESEHQSEPQSENLRESTIGETFIMGERRTIGEIRAPNLDQQPLCIAYPTLEGNATFELKSGLIHLLPEFNGLKGENPNKHLNEFHLVCSGMAPAGVSEDYLKMRAFPFSLKSAAKDWLHELPPSSITSWHSMKKAFLEKYYPATLSSALKKEIDNCMQRDGESFHEY